MGDTVCRWGAWACPFSIPVSKQKRRGMLVCIHRVPIGNTRMGAWARVCLQPPSWWQHGDGR
eukprot:scaffold60145_cov15-Tisochrysis_lutea.AAC.1